MISRKGICKEYDEDGKLIAEKPYVNGNLEGISKEYDGTGN